MVDYMPQGTVILPAGASRAGSIYTTSVQRRSISYELKFDNCCIPGSESYPSPGSIHQIATEYAINFNDGVIVKGTFQAFHGGFAYATVSHPFTFLLKVQAGCTGHTFLSGCHD